MVGMLGINWISLTLITAGASLTLYLAYIFYLIGIGKRRLAIDEAIKNIWVIILATSIAVIALNIGKVSELTGIPVYLFDYQSAIKRVEILRGQVKTLYLSTLYAEVSAVSMATVIDLFFTLGSFGLTSALQAIIPLARIVAAGFQGIISVLSHLYLFLTFTYWLLIILQPIAFAILGFGASLLPIPRGRRLGITIFILGLMFVYVLPYIVNSSLSLIAQPISSLYDRVSISYGVLYIEGPPYAALEFNASIPIKIFNTVNKSRQITINGIVLYQIPREGKRIIILPAGNYTLNKVILGYAEFITNNTIINVRPGVGKFFANEEDALKYIDYLKTQLWISTGGDKEKVEYIISKCYVTDGELYYVGYPYAPARINISLADLNSFHPIGNRSEGFTRLEDITNGESELIRSSNENIYKIFVRGVEENNTIRSRIVIRSFSVQPEISFNVSDPNYVKLNYTVSRVAHPYFRPVSKDYLYNIYNQTVNWITSNNITTILNQLYKYGNFTYSEDLEGKFEDSIYSLPIDNQIYLYAGIISGEDIRELINNISNITFYYPDNLSEYLITIYVTVKPHPIKEYINLIGKYRIYNDTKLLYVEWNNYRRYYNYDDITYIDPDGKYIEIIFNDERRIVDVWASAIVNNGSKTILVKWNDIELNVNYNEIVNITDSELIYVIYKVENASIIVRCPGNNWSFIPYLTLNPGNKFVRDFIAGRFENPVVRDSLSLTSSLAYRILTEFILLLIAMDGIAAAFGGVSGIAKLGGKIYRVAMETYVVSQLSFYYVVSRLLSRYREGINVLASIKRLRGIWQGFISRYSILGSTAVSNVLRRRFPGRDIEDLGLANKINVIIEGLRERGSILTRILGERGLKAFIITYLSGRKIRGILSSRMVEGTVRAVKDVVGGIAASKELLSPEFGYSRWAKAWRALDITEKALNPKYTSHTTLRKISSKIKDRITFSHEKIETIIGIINYAPGTIKKNIMLNYIGNLLVKARIMDALEESYIAKNVKISSGNALFDAAKIYKELIRDGKIKKEKFELNFYKYVKRRIKDIKAYDEDLEDYIKGFAYILHKALRCSDKMLQGQYKNIFYKFSDLSKEYEKLLDNTSYREHARQVLNLLGKTLLLLRKKDVDSMEFYRVRNEVVNLLYTLPKMSKHLRINSITLIPKEIFSRRELAKDIKAVYEEFKDVGLTKYLVNDNGDVNLRMLKGENVLVLWQSLFKARMRVKSHAMKRCIEDAIDHISRELGIIDEYVRLSKVNQLVWLSWLYTRDAHIALKRYVRYQLEISKRNEDLYTNLVRKQFIENFSFMYTQVKEYIPSNIQSLINNDFRREIVRRD